MPSVTVAGSNNQVFQINYNSTDVSGYAQSLANTINAAVKSGQLSTFTYTGGATAPGPATGTGGQVVIGSVPGSAISIPNTDSVIVDNAAGPSSIFGGSAVSALIAGSGGLTFVSGVPVGVENIVAGDTANYIVTANTGGGTYNIATGAGNDTVGVFTGNSTVNAGTGSNKIQLGTGNSFVFSVGSDSVVGNITPVGSPGAGGTDTVDVLSGNVTINPGSSNFFVFGNDLNPVTLLAGSGSDTVALGIGGGTVTAGTGGNSLLVGGLNTTGTAVLTGSASGDRLYAIGYGTVVATAGAGNETISGAGGAPYGGSPSFADNRFTAGSGNDTLLAGRGLDTLTAGTGKASLVAGTAADTFAFQNHSAGGADTISGFKVASDTISLTGYGLTPANALSTAVQQNGGTVITLADGTSLTVSGVTNLTAANIKTS